MSKHGPFLGIPGLKPQEPISRPKPFYRIQWFCPVCDKPHETIGHLIPRPRLDCGDCLMRPPHQIVEMTIESAEQLPDEPMVNIKVVGPNGEELAE